MQTKETIDRAIGYANEVGGIIISLSGLVNGYPVNDRRSRQCWWHAVITDNHFLPITYANSGPKTIAWWPDDEMTLSQIRDSIFVVNGNVWVASGWGNNHSGLCVYLRPMTSHMRKYTERRSAYFFEYSDHRTIPVVTFADGKYSYV